MIRSFFLTVCVICFVLAGKAQVLFGVHAGIQQHTVNYSINDIKQSATGKTGFEVGINAKIFFDEKLYFNPFIYYSLKKYSVAFNKPSYPPSDVAIDNDATMHTVEFAPLLQYDFSYDPSHFFVRFGPSLDIGVGGTETFHVQGGAAQTQKVIYSNGEYSRVAASAIVHLGYEFKNDYSVFGFYEYGFGSRNNADDGPKIFHRVFGLSIGKYFGHNPNVFDTRVKR